MGEYLAELNEQLEELNDCLLQLESSDGDTTEITQKIFRLAHTIKGSAATMGFDGIASVSHAFEDLLDEVQARRVTLSDEVVEAMLAAFDHIRSRAVALQDGEAFDEDPAPLVARLRGLSRQGAPAAPAAPPPAAGGDPDDFVMPPGIDLSELDGPLPAAAAEEPAPTSTEDAIAASLGAFEIDLSQYMGEYMAELNEQLEGMNDALLELESDPTNKKTIQELFRLSHTIKGAGATMGFNELARLAHAFEDLLEVIRGGQMACDAQVFEALLMAFDGLGAMAATLPEPNPAVDVDAQCARLRAILSAGTASPPQATTPEALGGTGRVSPPDAASAREVATRAAADLPVRRGASDGLLPEPLDVGPGAGEGGLYKIVMSFDEEQEMRSVRAFLVLNHIQEVAELLSSRPTVAEVEEDQLGDSLEMVVRTKISEKEIQNILSFGEAEATQIIPISASEGAAAMAEEPPPAAAPVPPAPPPPPAPTAPPPERSPPPMPTLREFRARSQPSGPAPGAIETPGARIDPTTTLLASLEEEQKSRVVECLNSDQNVLEVTVLLNDAGERSGARALTILNYLRQNAEVIHCHPRDAQIRDATGFTGSLQALISTDREVEQLRELALAEEVEKTSFTPIALDGLELVTTEEAHKRSALRQREGMIDANQSSMPARPGAPDKAGNIPTVRVTVDRLDHLMNLVAELVISKTQLQQLVSQFTSSADLEALQNRMVEVNGRLSRITTDLQEGIMKARMVQIGQVFFRFTRLVRDLSKSLGKNVEFLIEGTETELDKTVIDEIGDPLMHLIRNALDHGIEAPEVRKKKGKPPKGILLLKASHAGDHIVVETADDGKGMEPEKIRASAVRKGLITEAEAKALSPSETFNLIFAPGFSTAAEVTSVSGRGVGMDVVKTTIESLGGEIQVKSEVNVGTSIQIKLPLTLAIIQGLLVRVGGEIFTIPLSTVKETVQLQDGMIHNFNGYPAMVFRGEMLTLLYLDRLFEIPSRPRKKRFIVFAGVDEEKVGIVVDQLIGRREIVIKSLDRTFMDVRGFAGATVLGDGQVSLILDVPALMDQSKKMRKSLQLVGS